MKISQQPSHQKLAEIAMPPSLTDPTAIGMDTTTTTIKREPTDTITHDSLNAIEMGDAPEFLVRTKVARERSEDDDAIEPSAKRLKLEENTRVEDAVEAGNTIKSVDLVKTCEPVKTDESVIKSSDAPEALIHTKVARERPEDDDANEPSAKRLKLEDAIKMGNAVEIKDITTAEASASSPAASTATALARTGISRAVPAVEFVLFMQLPYELREQIWKYTILPRLVHWRPGGGKPPAIMHVCQESRELSANKYTLCLHPELRDGLYGIFVNYEMDILYRKQRLPKIHPGMDIRQRNAFKENMPPWLRPVKFLAINLGEALSSRDSFPLFLKLRLLCPDLEELTIQVWPYLNRLTDGLENITEMTDPCQSEEEAMTLIRRNLQAEQADGFQLGLSLRFTTYAD